jgi:alpha-tubulin suppressor-like RCC1 family protein
LPENISGDVWDEGVAFRSHQADITPHHVLNMQLRVVARDLLVVILAIGSGSAALASDIIAWGNASYYNTNVPPGLTNAIKLGGGYFHTLALTETGGVVAWGNGMASQATNVPAGLSGVVEVAGGVYHSLALKSDGTVAAWGSLSGTNVPAGLSNVIAVAAGGHHSLALHSDGGLVEWGTLSVASMNTPTGSLGVVGIASGERIAWRCDRMVRSPFGVTIPRGRPIFLQA